MAHISLSSAIKSQVFVKKCIYFVTIVLCLSGSVSCYAQYRARIFTGPALPFTGFKSVVKGGWVGGLETSYRLRNQKVALGLQIQYARFSNDANATDNFKDAKLTMVPVLFRGEIIMAELGIAKLYGGANIGVSIYELYHNQGLMPTENKTKLTVGFTMAPEIGLSFPISNKLSLNLNSTVVMLMDGPPKGVVKSNQISGYTTFNAGLSYELGSKGNTK